MMKSRSPHRPFFSPGDSDPRIPPSPGGGAPHSYHPYGDRDNSHQQRRDFRPPAPAAAARSYQAAGGGHASHPPGSSIKDSKGENSPPESPPEKLEEGKKQGDPLSVLADVSAGMGGKDKQQKQDSRPADDGDNKVPSTRTALPGPTPTSPLQRRPKPSPITPSQTPQEGSKHRGGGAPPSLGSMATPGGHQPITPVGRSHDVGHPPLPPGWEPPPQQPGPGEPYAPPEYAGPPPYNSPLRRGRPGPPYGGGGGDFGHFPSDLPALVERGSFDSHGDGSSYRGPQYPPGTPPSRGYFYDDHGPPPPGYGGGSAGRGGGGYWEGGGGGPPTPYSPSYPPGPRGNGGGWSQGPPPPSRHDPYYGPPPPAWTAASRLSSFPTSAFRGRGSLLRPPAASGVSWRTPPAVPPSPPRHAAAALWGAAATVRLRSAATDGGEDDSEEEIFVEALPRGEFLESFGPLDWNGKGIQKNAIDSSLSQIVLSAFAPLFAFFMRPRTFQLERFLIANRDEYLKHSNMNYTAEQKQYNNWLTDRLLEVSAQHSYVFDPEDFNFVAIRDRIRCYYKSYVQTARKRGLKLPDKQKD